MLKITDPTTIILVFIAIFLLALIIIGVVLLATRKRDKKVSSADYDRYADVKTDIIPGAFGKAADDGGRQWKDMGGSDPVPGRGVKTPPAYQPPPQEEEGTVDLYSYQGGGMPSGYSPATDTMPMLMGGMAPPAMGSARNPARVVLTFKHNGMDQFLEMTANELVIGREEGCGLQIVSDGYLGKRHARLYWEGGVLYIDNISAKNGTSVNGKPITQATCITGDCLLTLAATSINLRLSDWAEAPGGR